MLDISLAEVEELDMPLQVESQSDVLLAIQTVILPSYPFELNPADDTCGEHMISLATLKQSLRCQKFGNSSRTSNCSTFRPSSLNFGRCCNEVTRNDR
jgi:hypothetical protein